jgi:hypothetical protein
LIKPNKKWQPKNFNSGIAKASKKSWYWLWWSLTTCHFPSSHPQNSPFPKQLNKNQPKNNNQPKMIVAEAKEALER